MQETETHIDHVRKAVNKTLDPAKRSALGQFFTPDSIALFMAGLFTSMAGPVSLLEPGAGIGSLIAAFVREKVRRGEEGPLTVQSYEIEKKLSPFFGETIKISEQLARRSGFIFSHSESGEDFISAGVKQVLTGDYEGIYSHVIMNPPYKKIASDGVHRKILREAGIETVNLYSGFVALALLLLKNNGELVAIIPRSFCNGPYYQPFRELLLRRGTLRHIHLFERRNQAFGEDDVLQENIIIHFVKGETGRGLTVTSSPGADFTFDRASGTFSATDMTIREMDYSSLVHPGDPQQFIHITANDYEQGIIDRLSCFQTEFKHLGIQVSTGPVVDFRNKEALRDDPEKGAVPLFYPNHFNNGLVWPKAGKKPNAILVTAATRSSLWDNKGCYVITKRFSSKEEFHRIMASVYDGSLPFPLVAFENKLNVFHSSKSGLGKELAGGLYIYLNSSLLDKYYRQFGGHTQVNSSDLRSLKYPSGESLARLGAGLNHFNLEQAEIDRRLDLEIERIQKNLTKNPLMAHQRIEEALHVLAKLGMPRQQLNERSALTFLALLELSPEGSWQGLARPMIGVTPIMDWTEKQYGKSYAANTREAFRRQTLHQFMESGIVVCNPDNPGRPVNSPKTCYQIPPELHAVLLTFETAEWEAALEHYLAQRETLVKKYAMERDMAMIPLQIDEQTTISLSAGEHSELIHAIIVEFGPRFVPGAEVIYVGDTGSKAGYFLKEKLEGLGVKVDDHGKMPDVVLYWAERNWLILIESVTSHGPVDSKRYGELKKLFSGAVPGLVFVTAFPGKKTFKEYLDVISWETEVWFADSPTHMMHLNGDRFLGPHN